jgi:hypothetical protein
MRYRRNGRIGAQRLDMTRLPLPFWATATSRPSCAAHQMPLHW